MKKILFSSDCNGNFELLFSKVSQLNQKTKFDLMFLVGNVCPIEAGKEFDKIAKGQIIVPIPTYFINSSPMSKVFEILYPQGQQIGSNFHFLGKQGVKNIQGLNVCYLNETSSQNSLTALNIIADCSNSKIDVLLTNQWPVQILQNYKQKVILNSQTQTRSSETVSLLNYFLSPRYHLAASGKQFYRMEPYLNAKGQSTHFINVAQIIKIDLKDKYLLAIQLVPYSLNPPAQDAKNNVPSIFDKEKYQKLISSRLDRQKNIDQNNSTQFIQNDKQNPSFRQTYQLKQSQKPKQQQNNLYQDSYIYFDCVPAQARSVDIQQFLQRWGTIIKLQVFEQTKGGFRSGLVKFQTFQQSKKCLQDSGKYSLYQSRIKFKPKNISQKYHNADCWFCEKNDRFDRELLVWKGKYCMICLDKGPIAEVHLQIIPYNHVDTLGKLQSIQLEEIEFVKSQLSTYFTRQQYQVIFSERYIGLSEQINHCILHFIAIESQLSLTSKFMQLNQQHRFNFFKIQNAQSHKRKTQHFIKLTINEVQFIKQIYPKQKTDAEFPRRVICEVINQPSKINWRNCELQDKQIKDKREKMGNVLNKCLE